MTAGVVRRALVLAAALAVVGVAAGTAGTASKPPVRLAMISPLTGPLSFVGVDNRAGVLAAIREVNRKGGIKGRKIALDIYDDGSNPSQGVLHMQRIASDPRYLGVIGSGFSSVGLAVQPIVSQVGIPYISMASSAAQVTPAKPFYFMTTATSRLFAYSMAQYLRRIGVKRVAVMNDSGGFGREGQRNVRELARAFGFDIVEEITFPLTATTFTSELIRVKNSNAQALWVWNATSLAVTITKEMRQLRLPQRLVLTGGNASVNYLQPACPQANGALMNTYIGPVAQFVRKSHASRKVALRVNRLLRKQGSTFNYDGYTAVWMFKRAMERGGFTRRGINNALERRLRGFVGPGGHYYYSQINHSGLGVNSMVVSVVRGCKLRPVAGSPLTTKK